MHPTFLATMIVFLGNAEGSTNAPNKVLYYPLKGLKVSVIGANENNSYDETLIS